MPFIKITNNLYLGDQFSNKLKTKHKELKISNIYYDMLKHQYANKQNTIYNDYFVKIDDKLALNLLDSHDPSDFNDYKFALAIKFISENIENNLIYTHCQLGVSRSASTIFIYLVISKTLNFSSFEQALNEYLTKIYPYMKVNYGVYNYLKNNFPYTKVKNLSKKTWGDLLAY
ncbi:dual specificity protein phosphatase family protein [Spiroplasma endosymbiont of Cantharis nigra]|uniref:dual specificity protein phosphatase family protein n=1 Tax=Spiroplasma endosymbiont of Cantharis nigra TaxID=3066278 RepID=UPI0030D50900